VVESLSDAVEVSAGAGAVIQRSGFGRGTL